MEIPTAVGHDIDEPREWPFDGDLTRRVDVLDHNFTPPRLVRRCGYQKCLRCREPFWSPSVRSVRMCDACKITKTADSSAYASKPGPKQKGRSAFGEIDFARRS
jgi:hypothetical protein